MYVHIHMHMWLDLPLIYWLQSRHEGESAKGFKLEDSLNQFCTLFSFNILYDNLYNQALLCFS